jgi:hypothetical protein
MIKDTLLSCAASYWATLHSIELRRSLYWATPHPTELRRSLYWATPHSTELRRTFKIFDLLLSKNLISLCSYIRVKQEQSAFVMSWCLCCQNGASDVMVQVMSPCLWSHGACDVTVFLVSWCQYNVMVSVMSAVSNVMHGHDVCDAMMFVMSLCLLCYGVCNAKVSFTSSWWLLMLRCHVMFVSPLTSKTPTWMRYSGPWSPRHRKITVRNPYGIFVAFVPPHTTVPLSPLQSSTHHIKRIKSKQS